MKNQYLLLAFLITATLSAQTADQVKKITKDYDFKKIESLRIDLQRKAVIDKEKAEKQAKIMNWPILITKDDGSIQELMKIGIDGNPIYYATDNAAAARATRANHLHSNGSLGLNLNGQGMTARIWDGGRVRLTHNLFSNRVSTIDDNTTTAFSQHATHVTGTVIASNASTSTKGMAFEAMARTFNWGSDQAEVLSEVTEGMLISNHSYGIPLVSTSNVKQSPWLVGAYIQDTRTWDEIAYLSPNYLMVTSAGNSGLDENLEPTAFGFDKLIGNKLSKNVLTIANAQDVAVDASGNVTGTIDIHPSSSQGPADDGRIKPDITGNGTGLLSASNGSNTATTTLTGTSMASPNVAGTLLLVQQHYNNVNGSFMKAATLKGLATHTADDAGNIGPDAIFGWGLLNAKKCVETINQNGFQSWISEETLRQNQSYSIKVRSNGTTPLIGSITWTDVPGDANNNNTIVNNPTPALVNDLDIRITKDNTVFYPWRLTSDPSAEASRNSDNNVDNVENIKIDAPTAGEYTITVTHKGTLVGGLQKFSLIVTGTNSSFSMNEVSTGDVVLCSSQNTVFGFNYKQVGNVTTNFSVTGLPAGALATFNNNSLSANGAVNLTLSNLTAISPGIYTIGITGNNGVETETRFKTFQIYSNVFQPISVIEPQNNIADAATASIIKWQKNVNAESYKVEIATDNNFSTIISSTSDITDNFHITSGLSENTTYFYRVIPSNRCGASVPSTAVTRKFTTGILECGNAFNATDFTDSTIVSTANGSALIPINVTGNLKIGDINVSLKINHTYVQDMTISLIGPASIGSPEVFLTKETCGEFNNIDATFDDNGGFVDCSTTPPSIGGTIMAVGSLSTYNGMLADGIWQIKVLDPYDGDGGNVISAKIDICKITPSTLSNSSFENNNFAIYPNPTDGILNIDTNFNDNLNSKLSFIDATGRTILTKNLEIGKNIIDTTNFQKGIYFLTIQNGTSIETEKIILK